ncbi:transcription-repair coupling factor [Buchnera aphidicola str. Bp (Baizongia pistaciae)]|uniref:Transcription-repair-coupling factor n=1 Tax=Buchnera aphidicola subsp. Baizongia pistaciae (strain Bp) TaxID=224915 RepID=MFD_BUCBP|nr:transcription-repair coupling factor [Buchnera aphidicola]Q89AK2.1 RecName: Full=Transcription-repair-coupling factor; Short=TRCF [Buchnera aphidicola str. Bp (Baizongia pistaciae)]AAO27000.1 transcription-repair coupling factor [Buchnera aphidicola str. Bp (Baizongia pistaciae)]
MLIKSLVQKNQVYFTNNSLDEKNICDLSKLKINQPIVHFEHGVGRYQGLTTVTTRNIKTECVVINYAQNSKLYVPITYLYLISRYIGTSKKDIPLHRLGNDLWNKEKKKANEKAYDSAAILLNIYSHRISQKGFSFKKHHTKYKIFCERFPFTLTPDQDSAINSVLSDMYKSTPMDRLVCGDVGFGKTEVAMRATFLAVCNQKQVAILVPTTLLAQQHFNNFTLRFKYWSTKIEILSRFQSETKCNEIINNVNIGNVHVLIGTHKILLKNLKWKNLGLLIVDEEHRFGVHHKEQIKLISNNIDVLTLTATPIPRTLNMAFVGIRDLSIIATPPKQRLIVKTFVREFSYTVIRKAILREILRGGQVYYIYNNVNKIERKKIELKKLVPEANIRIGHGQLRSTDLESIMNDFYHKRFNVLVCSTIIETGIDIPNVNTIIIENANNFGLAQLHQLRGRVGRSQHQAYAWLLVPSLKDIKSDAKKRIDAITSIESFGSCFELANRDLEIRGIGEILGNNQSGHITKIGFSLYMKLLMNAVRNIKNGYYKPLNDIINTYPKIELNVSNLLPDSYIKKVNHRLFFYNKIATSNNFLDLEKIRLTLCKNFGNLPNSGDYLIKIAKIRLISKKIGVKKIKSDVKGGYIEFFEDSKINIQNLLKEFKKEKNCWKFDTSNRLRFSKNFKNNSERIDWILNMLININN